jgi:hypothetical protein
MVKPPPPKRSIDVPDNSFAESGVEFKNRWKGKRLWKNEERFKRSRKMLAHVSTLGHS